MIERGKIGWTMHALFWVGGGQEVHAKDNYVKSQENILHSILREGGHAVAQLVEALRYKLEGRGFDSRWCHWNFSLICSFRPRYVPGVDSPSNRNEYQEYFLGVKAAGA